MPATADLPLIRPPIFRALPGIAAAFTTRASGPAGGGLNMGYAADADPADVDANRQRLLDALDFNALATAGQVHGADVEVVTEAGRTEARDGLVTDRPGLLLGILTADCGCVLLADGEAGVVGACHAGWRGAVAGVVPNTLTAMCGLGADPARIRAAIGPCISAAHFEVGPEVAAEFDDAFVTRAPGRKPHVDLKAAIQSQLVAAGVPAAQVWVDDRCTFDTATFFSYRKEGGATGRMMGVVGRRS